MKKDYSNYINNTQNLIKINSKQFWTFVKQKKGFTFYLISCACVMYI